MDRKSSPEPGTGTSPAPQPMPAPVQDQSKRYRPAPAKTFQCRGYGECRMVFSRSEHLARHIRKHTGERPFTCHCSKQFSRLDNLRQHAQTVHADKQEQNERMMRDLTSLHASMAAANKISNARNSRRVSSAAQPPPPPPAPATDDADDQMVKQEDLAPISYDASELYPQQQHNWQPEIDNPKYFQPFPPTASRPSTSERLPPLSSIVSASIPQQQQQQQYSSSFLRPRPGTAGRPSSSSSATSFYPNPPTNLLSTSKSFYYQRYDAPTDHPPATNPEPSPFYFAPPEARNSNSISPPTNPRKRAFAGPDGPVHSYDDLADYSTPQQQQQQQPSSHHLDYDYGSESRPQSRRLSVMELCNTAGSEYVDGMFVNGDRPSTAQTAMGLVSTTSAMSIFDRGAVQRRPSPAASGSGRSDEGRHPGGRVSPPSRRLTPHVNNATQPNGGMVNGTGPAPGPAAPANGYAPPPRPHSTTYSVSSTSSASNSPAIPQYSSSSQQQQHFAYPHHPHSHHHQQPYAPLNLVGAMSSLHHHTYTPSPAPTPSSAASYYAPSPRSSSFSPRSPHHVTGHLAHQQAQAYQALQAQQQGGYPHGHGHGHGHAHGHAQGGYPQGAYEYGQGYSA